MRGIGPLMFTSWVVDFKFTASQPAAPHGRKMLVVTVGLEPTLLYRKQILSLQRLPFRHMTKSF